MSKLGKCICSRISVAETYVLAITASGIEAT